VRSERIGKHKKSVLDTVRVLSEVLKDSADPNRTASVLTILDLAVLLRSLKSTEAQQAVLKRVGVLSVRDQDLAVGLFRELHLARSRFQQSVFVECRWRTLPPPGYLDLARALKLNVYSGSRLRPSVTSTPPRLFAAAVKSSPGSGCGNTNGGAALLKESSTPPCPSSKGAQREGPRAHIQLDIMGADKLSPASMRRGAQEGEQEADRKPGLRISLLLPPAPSSPSSSSSPATALVGPLNVVKRLTRDFGDKTLNPRFDTKFVVPLPVPRVLLPGSGSEFRPLMEWWAGGVLKVEVLDGERFNRDHFLGEIDLLLSQFLLSPVLSGTFPLTKQSVGDRVSGTITVAAYLHLPETPITASPSPAVSVLNETTDEDEGEGVGAVEPPVKMIAQSVRASRQRIPRKITSPITIPPLPPTPVPQPTSNADEVRRKKISECLDGLDALTGSTDELLLLASKLTRAVGKQKSSP
jgi:hypothetical protein